MRRQTFTPATARKITASAFVAFVAGLAILIGLMFYARDPSPAWMVVGGSLLVIGAALFIGMLIWHATVTTTFGDPRGDVRPRNPPRQL